MKFTLKTMTFIVGSAMLAGTGALSAPPTKPVANSNSKLAVEDLPVEVPAVPYVTLGLIRDPAVHQELKLNPKQIDAVQSAIAEVDEPFWQLRDVPVNKCSPQLDALLAKLRLRLKDELTASQLARLDQIILQARSWKVLVTPELSKRLNLSTDQVSRLRSLLTNVLKQRDEAEKSLTGETAANREKTLTMLRKAESRRFTDVLSAKQQAEFGEVLGKPFDLSRVTHVGCIAPELRGVSAWINSEPITLAQQRGKVVVVHFWAFGCINCIRNLPHYQGWYESFPKSGLTIIGIQTPETESERSLENLKRQVIDRKIEYPVALDSATENWKAWGNDMWPSVYLIDKQGRVRNWWYGELNWKGATGEEFLRKRIEELLAEK